MFFLHEDDHECSSMALRLFVFAPPLAKVNRPVASHALALCSTMKFTLLSRPSAEPSEKQHRKLQDAGVDVVELRLPHVADAMLESHTECLLDGCRVSNMLYFSKMCLMCRSFVVCSRPHKRSERSSQVESVKRVNLAAIPKSSMQGYMDSGPQEDVSAGRLLAVLARIIS